MTSGEPYRARLQPSTAGDRLLEQLRAVAARNDAVGESALLNCIPRDAFGREHWDVKASRPQSKDQTFLYVPAGVGEGVPNTPNIALPGGIRIIDTTLSGEGSELTLLRVEPPEGSESP